jgi:hypothetical protein
MTVVNGVQIYREVANLAPYPLKWLEARDQLYEITDPKGVPHLFLDNDTPRDIDVTPGIIDATVGFALFDAEGEYIGSYRSLDRAIAAQEGAKIVVQAEFEGAAPDDDVRVADEPARAVPS